MTYQYEDSFKLFIYLYFSFKKEFNTFANHNSIGMNKIFLTLISLLFFVNTDAQLLNEIGVSVGGTNYSGDIGQELFILPTKIGASLVYKRNLNSRLVGRLSLSYLPIADDDANSSNTIRNERGYSFTNTLYEAAFGVEFNYFEYDVMSRKKGFTPYIFVEFAGFYYDVATDRIDGATAYGQKVSYSIPFGIGYKSRITDRIGYALELRSHYTFEDDLDYNNQDFSDLRFGNINSTDWYFYSGVTLTYSFGRPPCFYPRPF